MKKCLLSILLPALCLAASSVYSQAPNYNITLADQLTYSSQSLSNIWYHVDSQGNEYALVGAQNGISIVNVTNPGNVFQVAQLNGPSCSWREIKTVGNYAYISSECGTVGLQIVDLSGLPTPPTMANVTTWTPTIMSTQLQTIHALHAEAGRVYLYGSNIGNGGVIVADVSTTPMSPQFLGIYDGSYIHDGYVRNNKLYAGHIYDGWFSIMDVSNPASIPTSFPTQSTPGNFTHNTWLATGNDNTIFTTDEVNNSYLTSYDITNPLNIQELDRIQSQNAGGGSVVHNTHIINVGGNDYAVTSWYKDGVVITDVGRPGNLVNIAWYDTYTQGQGGGFSGCWGVNPFLPSGTIVASDINNGLFVLSPTYTRACYLEGTITDFNTSAPINAATITITSLNITDQSQTNGFYGTGCAVAGTYSVTYSKAGYIPQTVSVTLTNGVVTTQNIQLVPLQTITITGQVVQSWDNAGIPNARVKIWNGTFTFDTITDASGNFTIPSGYAGVYEVIAGKWSYVTDCIPNQSITQSSPPITIPLDSGWYDDFTFDFAWTESGTATTGDWERGEPLGTTFNNVDANPDVDVSADCFDNAYVTGNQGQSSSDDDVDGGFTLLTSPVFDLTGYQSPKLQYSRWFFNAGGNGFPNDSLRIYISNGSTTVTLETITALNPQSTWVNRTYYLNQLIPITSTMQLMVRAVDAPQGNLVEAGFDHFRVTDSLTISVGQELDASGNQLIAYPNPFGSFTSVMYAFTQQYDNAELIITDIAGRVIEKISIGQTAGEVSIHSIKAAGTYFVSVKSGNELLVKPVKIVKH